MARPKPGIDERAAAFQHAVISFVSGITPVPGALRVIEQLVSSSGSVNANRQEATAASSRKEFIRFNEIALRGARESIVWLEACRSGKWGDQQTCAALLDEAAQMDRILTAIVLNTKRRNGPKTFPPPTSDL